ncbi:MAG: hypothetical protein J6Y86_07480 [Pseudobutyrivibrio sp.]|nr:hypothetical protein [Pseudobutyrivibrio sp.]
MSTISKVVLPVKDPSTGVITNTEFDLSSGGSFSPVITNPTDGQLLKYDASQGAWVNAGIATTTVGSASAGTAIAADDITAWDAGTMTSLSVSDETLTVTSGTAPTLSYTSRSIPNISVTSKTVVTGVN